MCPNPIDRPTSFYQKLYITEDNTNKDNNTLIALDTNNRENILKLACLIRAIADQFS